MNRKNKEPNKHLVITIMLITTGFPALAESSNKGLPEVFSYFTAGFALLFSAIFGFNFCLRVILNHRTQKWTTKQMMSQSLKLALILSIVLLLALFAFLNS